MDEESAGSIQKIRTYPSLLMQQIYFIWWKKLLLTLYCIPVIVTEILLPLVLATAIALTPQSLPTDSESSQTIQVSSMISRIEAGRFLLIDPHNNVKQREIVEKVMENYPRIKVELYKDANIPPAILRRWPWIVGGVVTSQSSDWSGVSFIVSLAMTESALVASNLVTNIVLREGKFRSHVSWQIEGSESDDLWKHVRMALDEGEKPIYSFIILTASLFMTSSIVSLVVNERRNGFHHQQMLTGIPTIVFWSATLIFDAFVFACISAAMLCIRSVLYSSPPIWTVFVMIAYCVTILPTIYLLSFIFKSPGAAQTFCLLYQLFVGGSFLFLAVLGKDYRGYILLLPSFTFTLAELDYIDLSGKFKYTYLARSDVYTSFAIHGIVCFCVLLFIESQHNRILRMFAILRMFIRTFRIESKKEGDERAAAAQKQDGTKSSAHEVLEIRDLEKYYGALRVLKGITFDVHHKDCFGMVGASGAGKTTAFNIIVGITYRSHGEVLLNNCATGGVPKIGFCPQFDSLADTLSSYQNMMIIAGMTGYTNPRKKVKEVLRQLRMTSHCRKSFRRLSGGQKRRISVGVAILSNSNLLVLDEPTAGIDPKARRFLWDYLSEQRKSDRAVLLSSHSMEECEALCTRIGILCRGKLVETGAVQTLKSRYADSFVLQILLNSIESRDEVVRAISTGFPKSNLITMQKYVRNLKWHLAKDASTEFSEVFRKVEEMASRLPISDFCLTQASLEDVFIILNEKHSKD